MLNLLYSYPPCFIHCQFDDYQSSLLSMACEGGPRNAAFVHFLLDHGVDPSSFGSYNWRFGGYIQDVIEYNQPLNFITRMIPKTHHLWCPAQKAIRLKRSDILKLILDNDIARSEHHLSSGPLVGSAQDVEDKKVIAVVERYICNMEKQARKSNTRIIESKTTVARKWCPPTCQVDTNSNDSPKGSSNPNYTVGSAKSWWLLSSFKKR